ncbi:MAG: hypothetical protein N3D11_11490 [Candidatus Sumerlaeia bacterium]|nr:hypothetical protein [Candidatus Sumerlaeia bacterium]
MVSVYGASPTPVPTPALKAAPTSPPAAYAPPTGTATPIAETPAIDGRLTEDFWKKTAPLSGFVSLANGRPASPRTQVRLASAPRWLYVGAICETADLRTAQALRTERDSDVFNDESLEVLLDPVEYHGRVYRFVINARGARMDETLPIAGRGIADERPSWLGRVRRESPAQWTAEIAIDLASLDLSAQNTGVWRVNFIRHVRGTSRSDSAWAWARFWTFGCDRARMGVVSGIQMQGFLPNCKVSVADCNLQREGQTLRGSLTVEVANPADTRQTVDVTLRTTSRWLGTQQVKVNRLARESAVFPVEMDPAEEREFKVELTDPATRLPFAAIAYPFTLPEQVTGWFDRSYYTQETTGVFQSRVFPGPAKNLSATVQLFRAENSNLAWRDPAPAPILLRDGSWWLASVVPLQSLAHGGYLMETVWDDSARRRYRVWSPLRRLPPRAGEVKVDSVKGCLLRNGQPFFPIELRRLDQPTAAIFNDIKANGAFNVNWAWALAPRGTDSYIANAAKAFGALADLNIDRLYQAAGPERDTYFNQFKAIAASGNVFAYGMENPPFEDGFSTEPMTTLRSYLHSLDPYHPLYVMLGHPNQAARYRGCADFLVMHCRWSGTGGTAEPEWVYEQVRRAKQGAGPTVPVVAMLTAYRDAEQGLERPTPQQLRAAVYMALVAGAAGVIFDGYHYRSRTDPLRRGYADDPALLKAVYQLSHHAARLGPALLASEAADAMVSVEQPMYGTVRWRALRTREGVQILAVNGAAVNAVAAFQLPPLAGGAAWDVREEFEGRMVPLDGARFSVQFAPYETHVFVASARK